MAQATAPNVIYFVPLDGPPVDVRADDEDEASDSVRAPEPAQPRGFELPLPDTGLERLECA